MLGDLGLILIVLGIFILLNRQRSAIIGVGLVSPQMVNKCKRLGGKWFSPTGLGGCCQDCPGCTTDVLKCQNPSCPYYCVLPFREESRKAECERIKCWDANPNL